MVIDIILISIIFLGGFIGYKKGMMDIIIRLIALVLSILLAFILQTPISKAIYNSGLGNVINTTIKDGVYKTIGEENTETPSDKDKTFYTDIVKSITNEEQIDSLSESITIKLLKAVSFLIVFFIVQIIVYIIKNLLNIVINIPIVDKLNSLLGMSINLVIVIAIIFVVLMILYLISPMFDFVGNAIEQTIITKFLYNNNIFMTKI